MPRIVNQAIIIKFVEIMYKSCIITLIEKDTSLIDPAIKYVIKLHSKYNSMLNALENTGFVNPYFEALMF